MAPASIQGCTENKISVSPKYDRFTSKAPLSPTVLPGKMLNMTMKTVSNQVVCVNPRWDSLLNPERGTENIMGSLCYW